MGLACLVRGHVWQTMTDGTRTGRVCQRCLYSDQLTAHVYEAEGVLMYGSHEGTRRWRLIR